jgi:hypothetical protein
MDSGREERWPSSRSKWNMCRRTSSGSMLIVTWPAHAISNIVNTKHRTYACRRIRRMYRDDGLLSTQKGYSVKLEGCLGIYVGRFYRGAEGRADGKVSDALRSGYVRLDRWPVVDVLVLISAHTSAHWLAWWGVRAHTEHTHTHTHTHTQTHKLAVHVVCSLHHSPPHQTWGRLSELGR